MSKNSEWALSIGLYPGILIGMRTYVSDYSTTHVLYLPFIDIAYEIFEDLEDDE